MTLERFKTAQEYSYEDALAEISSGYKRTHWMWYVFPQVRGLGSSPTAQKYAIQSRQEAEAYEKDPVLGRRLREITEALLAQKESDPVKVFGSTDAMKLKSCMTLFAAVSEKPELYEEVLNRFFSGKRCSHTLEFLNTDRR
ncbi:MAG: DUF1810 domain-containing protein [Solobacterium sp.]|nr:DUF1810 domain-containing protein [Solobacterium sp.]